MILISTWTTYDLSISLPKISSAVIGIGIFFVTTEFAASREGWIGGILLLVFFGVGMSLLSYMGMSWPDEKFMKFLLFSSLIERFPQLILGLTQGTEGFNPNEVAGAVLWVIFPTLGLLLSSFSNSRLFRNKAIITRTFRVIGILVIFLILLIGFGIQGLLLILTQSRGAYIAFSLALLLVLLLLVPRIIRKYVWTISAAIFIAFVILAAPFLPTIVNALITAPSGQLTPALSVNSFWQRYDYWSYALSVIRDFPLTGIGMNTFRYVVLLLFPIPCLASGCDIGHAHNEFLQIALDLGIPGLIAFLSIYLLAFWMLIKMFFKADKGEVRDFPLKLAVLGLGGGLFSHMIWGLFDVILIGRKPDFLFWMLLGLICGLFSQYGPARVKATHED